MSKATFLPKTFRLGATRKEQKLWNEIKKIEQRKMKEIDWQSLHLTTGERQAHTVPLRGDLSRLRSVWPPYGERVAKFIADIGGRAVNANEYPNLPKFLVEMAERYEWQRIASDGLLPPSYIAGHASGEWYIHKMPQGIIKPYCNGNDVTRVFKKGLITPSVTAKPAKHLDTAVRHTVNFAIMMQHYWTGAQGLGDLALYWAPFVKFDHRGDEEILQEVQKFMYEINMPWRGPESPFTNLTISFPELDPSGEQLSRKAYVGGEEVGTYADFLEDAARVAEAFYEVFLQGDGRGVPFTYPVTTHSASTQGKYAFKFFKWLEESPERWELFWNAVIHRGFTYFLNSSVFDPEAVSAFCCRFLSDKKETREAFARIAEEAGETARGVFATVDVTGSLTIAGLNLPRLALEANKDEQRYFELLRERAREVGLYLVAHHKLMEKIYDLPDVYFMIKQYMNKAEFAAYFSTITLIGLPEAALLLHDGDFTSWGWGEAAPDVPLLYRAARTMRRTVEEVVKVAKELKEEFGTPVNVEESPAETASSKLFWKDWNNHPEWRDDLRRVLPPNPDPELDEKGVPLDMYGNTIVPYWGQLDLMLRMRLEAIVQPKFTGGVMAHIYMGESTVPEVAQKLVQNILSIGDGKEEAVVYFSWSPAMWQCTHDHSHGGIGIFDTCPICGAPAVTKMRIVGWNVEVKNYSSARQREATLRTFYNPESGEGKKMNNPFLERLVERRKLDPESFWWGNRLPPRPEG